MSYAVMHMQKLKAGGMRGIENHNERLKKSHTNPDINYDRSHLNQDLTPGDNRTYYRRVKERIEELQLSKAVRKDAVVCTGFICTSDSEFFRSLSGPETERFFAASLAFLEMRYGKKNVIAATIHHDETTPHLHTYIVPVTQDGRLSAKDIFNQKELRSLQSDYHRTMQDAGFRLERGQMAEETQRKHLSTQELKKETGRIQEALEAAKAAPAIPAKKKAFSAEVVVSSADWERMQKTYQYALEFLALDKNFEQMQKEVNRLGSVILEKSDEIEDKNEQIEDLDSQIAYRIKERTATRETIAIEKSTWMRTQERESVEKLGVGYLELKATISSQRQETATLSKDIENDRGKLDRLRREIAEAASELKNMQNQIEDLPHELVLVGRIRYLEKRLTGFLEYSPEIRKRYDAYLQALEDLDWER